MGQHCTKDSLNLARSLSFEFWGVLTMQPKALSHFRLCIDFLLCPSHKKKTNKTQHTHCQRGIRGWLITCSSTLTVLQKQAHTIRDRRQMVQCHTPPLVATASNRLIESSSLCAQFKQTLLSSNGFGLSPGKFPVH